MFTRFRNLIFLGAIGGAVGIPYFAAGGRGLDTVRQFFAGSGNPAAQNLADDPVAAALAGLNAAGQAVLPGMQPSAKEKEIAPPKEMTSVFQFDITIDRIMQEWPVVSMVPADPNQKLQGYRVPLVTGTRRPGDELGGSVINDDDLAGSLTYYFDSQHKLQKIVFDGVTGNAERLIRDVATPYGLERTQTTDPSLFLYQRNGWSKSESQLRVRTSELMTRASSNRRFQVWLVLTPKPASWF